MIELGERQYLDAGDAGGALSQTGRAPMSSKGERQVLAAGAHGGAAPDIHHQRARPFAVILQMAAQQLGGGFLGEQHGRARRHGAGIDGVEIAARGQHVGAAAGRRAGGTGAYELAVERGDERIALELSRTVEAWGERGDRHAGIGLCQRLQEFGAAVGIRRTTEDVQSRP